MGRGVSKLVGDSAGGSLGGTGVSGVFATVFSLAAGMTTGVFVALPDASGAPTQADITRPMERRSTRFFSHPLVLCILHSSLLRILR